MYSTPTSVKRAILLKLKELKLLGKSQRRWENYIKEAVIEICMMFWTGFICVRIWGSDMPL